MGAALDGHDAQVLRDGRAHRRRYHFNVGDSMDCFGRYGEVTPPSRFVCTDAESGENGSVTTVTIEDKGGKTLLVMCAFYVS